MTQQTRIDWERPLRSGAVFNHSPGEVTLLDLSIGPNTYTRLRLVADDVSADEDRQFRRLLPGASAKARHVSRHWEFGAPARAIDEILCDPAAFAAGPRTREHTRLRRAAVARLALDFFKVESRLPYSIIALYHEFFRRLTKFLCERAVDYYDDDYFAKDVRYALGLTVPAGAAHVDLHSRIGPKLIGRDLLHTWSPATAFRYAASAGWGQWYNEHLDLRWMKDFNPTGWTACYARIAELLELNPRIRGLAGVSWFYDPAVASISPHLAYLREMPVQQGAFLVRMGTLPHDIGNATVRSPLRRRLYEEGRYQPTCYVLAWPRRRMIAWARNAEAGHGVAWPPRQGSA